jgi:hypothetical protein
MSSACTDSATISSQNIPSVLSNWFFDSIYSDFENVNLFKTDYTGGTGLSAIQKTYKKNWLTYSMFTQQLKPKMNKNKKKT